MSLFSELKRRNVFRVAIAYVLISWLVLQVADTLTPFLELPPVVGKTAFWILVLGFLPVLLFSWAYELTPEGIKKESEVDRTGSILPDTAKKLDLITLVAVVGLIALVALDRLFPKEIADDSRVTAATESDAIPARLGDQSIAVLPFANRSNLDDDMFFTDGIHDDLLTQLAKFRDLKVISRTSVMEYRGTEKKIPDIGGELGVAKVLEGGVQRAGPKVRINAQLIDAATDEHLWGETYEREMTIDNLFDIQSEITREIVAEVKGQLSPEEQQALASAPTQSVEAYENFMRARLLLTGSGYNARKYRAAQPFVEQALRIDEDFALAHLLLSEIHGAIYWIGDDETPERQQAASASLERARLLLDANSPELLAAQGEYLYRFEQDYAAAQRAQLKAHAAMPGNTEILKQIGLTQRRLGLWDESATRLLQGMELNPADVDLVSIAVDTLAMMQRWQQLREVLPAARLRFADNTDLAIAEAMLPLWAEGKVKVARERYNRVPPNSGPEYVYATMELPLYERNFSAAVEVWDRPEVIEVSSATGWTGYRELNLAIAYRHLGQNETADEFLRETVQSLADINRNRHIVTVASELSTLAIALALQGESKRAIDTAEEAVELHSLENDKVDGTNPMKWLSYVLGLAGEYDRSLDLIAQLIDQPNGFRRWELYLHPRWDFFRDNERFNTLIRPDNIES
ncbi:MAG: hypothetical protein OEQ74_07910 [Gammaproteobacteria bacterium]|nr:hypothetical protein [Gammaproteobacteria bacterium]